MSLYLAFVLGLQGFNSGQVIGLGQPALFTSLAIALAFSFPLVDVDKVLFSLPASLLCGILNLKQEQLGCLFPPFTWYFKW